MEFGCLASYPWQGRQDPRLRSSRLHVSRWRNQRRNIRDVDAIFITTARLWNSRHHATGICRLPHEYISTPPGVFEMDATLPVRERLAPRPPVGDPGNRRGAYQEMG